MVGVCIITILKAHYEVAIKTTTISILIKKSLNLFNVFMVVRIELPDFKDMTSCMLLDTY
jgi:hypothetical protein